MNRRMRNFFLETPQKKKLGYKINDTNLKSQKKKSYNIISKKIIKDN